MNPPPEFPILQVAAFLDATTAVLVGHRVGHVTDADVVYVVGIGPAFVPNTNIPLIAPKAELEVTFAPGAYVIARSVAEERAVSLEESLGLVGRHTMIHRQPLTDEKDSYLGNPGRAKVKVGDIAVRRKDLSQFVKYWSEHPYLPVY